MIDHRFDQEIKAYEEFEKEGKSLSKLMEDLEYKRYSAKDTGAGYREINHWDEQGLLPIDKERAGWRKFNFFELVWIKLIIAFRSFNIPLDVIKKAKSEIYIDIPFKKMLENKKVEKSFKHAVESGEENFTKEDVPEDMTINSMKLLIADAIVLKANLSVLLTIEGKVAVFKELYFDQYIKSDYFNELLSDNYVSVSISKIIGEIINGHEIESLKNNFSLLTTKEVSILEIIRNSDDVKSISINFNHKKGERDTFEITTEKKVEKESQLIDLIMKYGYQEINIKTQNGNIVYTENVEKRKI